MVVWGSRYISLSTVHGPLLFPKNLHKSSDSPLAMIELLVNCGIHAISEFFFQGELEATYHKGPGEWIFLVLVRVNASMFHNPLAGKISDIINTQGSYLVQTSWFWGSAEFLTSS